MRKRLSQNNANKVWVDINGLKEIIDLGDTTLKRISKEAGAIMKVGRRTLYNVDKVLEYLEQIE